MTDSIQDCPVRNVLVHVTAKWQFLIIVALAPGPLRYGALKRQLGNISQRVLTEKLRVLERDGYISRTVETGPPLAVSYALTELGQGFHALIRPLMEWATENFDDISKSRDQYDKK